MTYACDVCGGPYVPHEGWWSEIDGDTPYAERVWVCPDCMLEGDE